MAELQEQLNQMQSKDEELTSKNANLVKENESSLQALQDKVE